MSIPVGSSCAYGGVDAMRAYQRQALQADQLEAVLAERRQQASAQTAVVNGNVPIERHKQQEQILVTAVPAIALIGINQPISGATSGSIINTTA